MFDVGLTAAAAAPLGVSCEAIEQSQLRSKMTPQCGKNRGTIVGSLRGSGLETDWACSGSMMGTQSQRYESFQGGPKRHAPLMKRACVCLWMTVDDQNRKNVDSCVSLGVMQRWGRVKKQSVTVSVLAQIHCKKSRDANQKRQRKPPSGFRQRGEHAVTSLPKQPQRSPQRNC